MKLYERLQLDLAEDIALENMLGALNLPPGTEVEITKDLRILNRQHVALAYYLLEDHKLAREHGTALVAEVEDYLLGAWRDTFTVDRGVPDTEAPEGWSRVTMALGREGCRRELEWMEQWRAGLVWALGLGLDDAVARLAEYPGPDLPDVDCDDFGPADKASFLVLARVLRGDRTASPMLGRMPETAILLYDRKKKPRLLLAALDRIVFHDTKGFQKEWLKCLHYHIQRELPERGLDNKLALDATILYYTARRTGMEIEVPDKYRDHVIRLKR
jgi:hypothetical protein